MTGEKMTSDRLVLDKKGFSSAFPSTPSSTSRAAWMSMLTVPTCP